MADLMDAPGRWDSKQLLAGARAGDADCLGWLLEIYRNYLHFLASAQMNERLRSQTAGLGRARVGQGDKAVPAGLAP